MSDLLDDAAAAALYRFRHEPIEHMGALFRDGDGFGRSNTVSSEDGERVRGAISIPSGSLAAFFHNHPLLKLEKGQQERRRFSQDDKQRARRAGVPSYISAGDEVHRYDPRTNRSEEVLAEFPIEEWRAYIMRTVLGREPGDARGALR